MSSTTIEVNLAVVAILISACTLMLAWLAFRRAGDWRQSDVGKDISAKLSGHGERLTKLETKLEDIPSKADIAALRGQISTLKAELDGVQGTVRIVAAGVKRIEQFLMDASQS